MSNNMFEERLRGHYESLRAALIDGTIKDTQHDTLKRLLHCLDRSADEIHRLQNIVQLLMDICKQTGTIVDAGYVCPHCNLQIVVGDSLCKVTGEQHAEP